MRPLRPILLLSLLAATTTAAAIGCGSAPSDVGDREPTRATSQALLTMGGMWQHGMPPQSLMQASDGFCFLTEVGGDFDSAIQSVSLTVQNGTWTLFGNDNKPDPANQLQTFAFCASWSLFSATPQLNNILPVSAMDSWGGTISSSLADTRSLCYLSELSGWFGVGDGVALQRDASLTKMTVTQTDNSGGQKTEGTATCINFNQPSPLLGITTKTVTFQSAQTWVDLNAASTPGVCMLAGVSGSMRGQGESVAVVSDGSGGWRMTGVSQQPGGITVTAVCMPFAQSVSVCTPKTCASQGVTCGAVSDGCGGTLSCGSCAAGSTCNAGTCQAACVPLTCHSGKPGTECGAVADTCGGTLDCGGCAYGLVCKSNACVKNDTNQFCDSCEANGGVCSRHGTKWTCIYE